MKNKPLAWMRTNKQWRKEVSFVEKEGFDIPLYTHPVKEQELLGEIAHLKAELDTANKAYMWMDETYKGVLAELELLKSHPVKELTDDELFHAIRRVGWTSIEQTDEIVEAIRKAQET